MAVKLSEKLRDEALRVLFPEGSRGDWYFEAAGDAAVERDGDCLVVRDEDDRVVARVRLVAEPA